MDFRRRRKRFALGAIGRDPFVPTRLARLLGSLTPGPPFVVGSSVGQVVGGQIQSANIVPNSYYPLAIAGGWTLNGAAALADNATVWDNGIFAKQVTAVNGIADFISIPVMLTVPSVIQPATSYAVQGQVSADPFFALANPSTSVRLAINFTGGVAREDSIDINPVTGLILAATSGLTGIFVERINVSSKFTIYRFGFVTPPSPAATNNAAYRFYPNSLAGPGAAIWGGAQIEAPAHQLLAPVQPTSFIPTPRDLGVNNQQRTRYTGVGQRQAMDTRTPSLNLPAGSTYNFEHGDSGTVFVINGNGITINVPFQASGIIDGDWFRVILSPNCTTFVTISSGLNVQGAGLINGLSSIKMPNDFSSANQIGLVNCREATFSYDVNVGIQISGTNEVHGETLFTANGNFSAWLAITRIWVDGSAGGGGGGGAAAVNSAAGGGGAGQSVTDTILTTVPGTTYAVTIGTGGNGGAAGNNNGAAGTATIIGALLTLAGGALGTGSATAAVAAGGAAGGAGASPGTTGFLIAGTLAFGGEGGSALFGQGGTTTQAAAALAIAGRNGSGFGSGGSGGSSGATGAAAAGGNGQPGHLTVKW